MALDPVMLLSNATDPSATFLSSSCFDFLLIELVPLSQRLTLERDSIAHIGAYTETTRLQLPGLATATGSAVASRRSDGEEELEAMHWRLDGLGYRVGQGLVERFSRDRPRFTDTLDVIKFICKDLWSLLFGKNVDNLKTNHRGVYVLTDTVFRPIARMSTEAGGQVVVRAQPFLWFPCGIVRGVLAALGIEAIIQAEISELPSAIFQIKIVRSKK